MAVPALTPNAILALNGGDVELRPTVQVLDVRQIGTTQNVQERYRLILSDGSDVQQAMLATQLNDTVKTCRLVKGTIIRLQEYICNTVKDRKIVIILNMDVLVTTADIIGDPKEGGSERPSAVASGMQQNYRPDAPSVGNTEQKPSTYGAPTQQRSNPYKRPDASNGNLPQNNNPYGAGGNVQPLNSNPYGPGGNVQPQNSHPYGPGGNMQQQNSNPYGPSGNVQHSSFYGRPEGPPISPAPKTPVASSSGPASVYGRSDATAPLSPSVSYGQPPANIQQPSPYGRPMGSSPFQPAPSYPNRGPIARNEGPPSIMPIKALNPYHNRWTIKARITAKSEMRRFNNARGDGKVFSFDLVDAEGGEIRVTCFNNVADQFYERAQVGQVYLMSKGNLKQAQKQFNHLNNEYEIMFEKDSTMEPCPEDGAVPQQVFNFKPISEIENMAVNATVDVLGVVVAVNPTTTIMRKNGMETQKRTLQLRDMSGKSVEFTMWGAFCGREGEQIQELFDSGQCVVVAVKAGRITEFSGKTIGTIQSSQVQINPDHPEVLELRQWFEREGRHVPAQSISRDGTGGGIVRMDNRKTVSQIKDEGLGRSEKPDFITIRATIHFIKTDTFCYTACPLQVGDRQCNKKVTNNGDGTWRCDRCDQTVPECDYRYLLSVQVMDHTGSTWLTAFQEAAEELLGVKAKDLFMWKQEDNGRFLDHIANVQFTQHHFKLKIKEESFNDEQRVKCLIQKTEKLDFVSESKYLLDVIGKLQRGEPMNNVPVAGAASTSGTAYGGGNTAGYGGASVYGNAGYANTNGGGYNTGTAGGYGAGHNWNAGSSAGVYNTTSNAGGFNSGGGYGNRGSNYGGNAGGYGGNAGGYGGNAGGYGGNPGGGGGYGASNGNCYQCGQGGHFARDCPNKRGGYGGGY